MKFADITTLEPAQIWVGIRVACIGNSITYGSGINDSIIVNGVIPVIKEVAKQYKLKTIDLHKATSGRPELFPDKIHPNDAGARFMATNVYKAVRKVRR